MQEQLADERRRLAQERAEVAAAAAAAIRSCDATDAADVGVAITERDRLVSRLQGIEARLADVDAALARVAAGRYGTCTVCGAPIAAARLAARPTATTCVEHAPT